ncbi:stage IV sporulation protein A, partial [Bacillus sp. D-CC]
LFEFPVLEVNVNLPSWVMVLNEGHWLRHGLHHEDVLYPSQSLERLLDNFGVTNVLREALFEFPVLEVNVNLPSWVMVLNEGHW